MSENTTGGDELDEIRRQKLDELESQLDEGDEASEPTESPSEPVHVNGADELDSLVADADVVLVDFYADWCGPCKMLEPTVQSLAANTEATVAKVDIDRNQPLAGRYNVRGVPTLLLFSDGEPVEQVVGVRDEETLAGMIAQYT